MDHVPHSEFYNIFKSLHLIPIERLRILIILSAAHDFIKSSTIEWRHPYAVLDYGCNIEDETDIGNFPNHDKKKDKAKAKWKDNFEYLYDTLFGDTKLEYINQLLDSGNVIHNNKQSEYNFKYISHYVGLTDTLKTIYRLLLLHALDSNESIYLRYASFFNNQSKVSLEKFTNILIWLHSEHFASQVWVHDRFTIMCKHIETDLAMNRIQAALLLYIWVSLCETTKGNWEYIHAALSHDPEITSTHPYFSQLARKFFYNKDARELFDQYSFNDLSGINNDAYLQKYTRITSIEAISKELNGSSLQKLIQIFFIVTNPNYSDYKDNLNKHSIDPITQQSYTYVIDCISNFAVRTKTNYNHGKTSKLLEILKNHGFSNSEAITLYTHINKYTKSKPQKNSVASAILKLGSDYLKLEQELQNKYINPITFMRELDDNNCDALIENNFVYEAFTRRIYHDGLTRAVIVNPSYELISSWLSDSRIKDCYITFAIHDKSISNLFANLGEDRRNFICTSDIEGLNYIFDCCLVFARGIEINEISSILSSVIKHTNPNGVVDILMPDEYISNEQLQLVLTSNGYWFRRIILMQTGLAESLPKKKSYVRLSSAALCSQVTFASLNYLLQPDKKRKKILAYHDPLEISRYDFDKQLDNIRNEYKIKRQTPSTVKRQLPNQYMFTQELSVYYTFSELSSGKYRAIFYATEFPTYKQENYNKLRRGKKLLNSELYLYGDTKAAIEQRVSQVPFNKKFREAVSNYVTLSLSSNVINDITLCTFWYCFEPDNFINKEGYSSNRAKIMFSNSELSICRCRLRSTSVDELTNAMKDFFLRKNISDKETSGYWSVLDYLIRFAVKSNYLEQSNEIAVFFANRRKKTKNKTQEIRDALTKKSLTTAEEKKFISYVKNKIHDTNDEKPEYLGVLIRFFTGLDPDEICALKWADYAKITNISTYYLKVYKRTDLKGDTIGPRTRERIRLVPLISELNNELKNLKSIVKKNSPVDIDSYPIVAKKNETKALSLKQFRKISLEAMVKGAGIKDAHISIPNKNSRNQSKISDYRGDLYRSNFRYRSVETCGFTPGELSYIIGNMPASTLSRHYCDYSNDFILLSLFNKLERWKAKYTDFNKVPNYSNFAISKNLFEKDVKPINYKRANLDLEITIPSTSISEDSEIVVKLSSDNGLLGKVILADILND